MNRYRLLLLLFLGVTAHYTCTSARIIGDDILLESINEHVYPNLIKKIKDSYKYGLDDPLKNCSQEFWKGLDDETREAYFDSYGKVGAGILAGNVVYLGYYDQCIDIGNTEFCRFPFNVTLIKNGIVSYSTPVDAPFEFGMCFPSACSAKDFYHLFFEVDEAIYSIPIPDINATINVTVPTIYTEPICPWRDLKWTPSSIIVLTICVLLVVLVIAGTMVDVLLWFISDVLPKVHHSEMKRPVTVIDSMSCEENNSVNEDEPLLNTEAKSQAKKSVANTQCIEFMKDFMLSFSLYKTVPTIMATDQPANAITSINGVRVISMFWVILGHTFLWGLSYGVTANVIEATETVPKPFYFQPVDNSFLSVDSFFVMSGLLLSYLTIREMDRRKGKFPFSLFYVHRILRLSPAYYFVVFFVFKILPYMGSGPLWHVKDVSRCEKYWWTNILYINNFYPTNFGDQCYGVTWYLATDMQFFIISPIFLLLLYHFWTIGLAAIAGTMLTSIAVIGTLAGLKNPNANLIQGFLDDSEDGASLSMFAFSNIYEKPYCRINAYLVGMVLGFVLYKKWRVKSNFWIRVNVYGAIWAVAAVCCAIIAFGQYQTWNGHPFNKAENIMFFMFSRTIFSTGIALMIYACHNGFGGAINTFLSWKFWIPLSRLTFMAYLSHPMVLVLMYSTMRFRFIYTEYFLIVLVVAAVVVSYGLAFVFAVFVEYPLANVESSVYKLAGIKRRK